MLPQKRESVYITVLPFNVLFCFDRNPLQRHCFLDMISFMMNFQEIEIITEDGLLLFDNQRDIEKCRILAYKTYQTV